MLSYLSSSNLIKIFHFYSTRQETIPPLLTLVKEGAKKYHEIGKAFFAFGVLYSLEHGGDGSLFFKAKTTELLYYYEKAFGARVLRHDSYDMFLFDKAALNLLRDFETEEE